MANNNNTERSLGRIEGKLDALAAQVASTSKTHHDRMNRIDTEIAQVDSRLRSVEKKQYTIVVIATFVASTASFFLRKLF